MAGIRVKADALAKVAQDLGHGVVALHVLGREARLPAKVVPCEVPACTGMLRYLPSWRWLLRSNVAFGDTPRAKRSVRRLLILWPFVCARADVERVATKSSSSRIAIGKLRTVQHVDQGPSNYCC